MDVGKLTVEIRNKRGKNEAKRIRAGGKVPGVCYGPGVEPMLISLDAKALKRALDPERKRNTVITMTVKGAGDADRTVTVMLKDVQLDVIRRDVEHVDLVVIDVNKEVTVEVPIVLTGKAAGVIDGGQLHAVYRSLPVKCKPTDIPTKIEVDVTALKMGEALHVADIKLPPGVKAAVDGGQTIASVVAPEVEKVVETAVVEGVEGAPAVAGAVPIAGAAPGAPGAAPGAAGAAPAPGAAPAKGEKKEGKK